MDGSRDCMFEMPIVDVFPLARGRTIFVGPVTGPEYLGACECELLIDERRVSQLKLEGEWTEPPKDSRWRAVSTTDRVDVELIRQSAGRCRLRGGGFSRSATSDRAPP